MQGRKSIRRSTLATRRVTCVLISLAMWRGPIPCIHQHAETAAEGTALNRHLAVYDHPAHQESTWHFHFVCPWADENAHDDGDPESSFDPVVAGEIVLPDATVAHAFADSCRAASSPAVPALLPDNPGPYLSALPDDDAPTFCGSLLASGPLCAVIGVSLS